MKDILSLRWKLIDFWDILPNVYWIASNGSLINTLNKIGTPFISNTGYYRIGLNCSDGRVRNFSIHRLVARAFIPNPNNLPIVNHIDGNKLNPDSSNLEWCSYRYNWEHARDSLKTIRTCGDQCHFREKEKYTIEMVTNICELLSECDYNANEVIDILQLLPSPVNVHSKEYRQMRKFVKNIRQRSCWKSISDNYTWGLPPEKHYHNKPRNVMRKGSTTIESIA